jgi:poly(3-hydroxybutyrate) depolymerase
MLAPALLLCACIVAAPPPVRPVPSVGCRRRPPHPSAPGSKPLELNTVRVKDPLLGEIERRYRVHVPSNYRAAPHRPEDKPYPVVINFHGYYLWDWADEEVTGLSEVSNRRQFIAVFPEGLTDTVRPWDGFSWNAAGTTQSPGPDGVTCQSNHSGYPCYRSCRRLHGCKNASVVGGGGCDSSTCADDHLFVRRMLVDLEERYCVDTERLHLTGISNGGMMVYSLAMDPVLGRRWASIAPVAGAPLLGFLQPPPVPMPLLDIHGVLDPIIPANASDPGQCCNPAGMKPGPHGCVKNHVSAAAARVMIVAGVVAAA